MIFNRLSQFILYTILSLIVSQQVYEINNQNYKTLINDSKNVFVLKVYSEMCGSCMEFNPIWKNSINVLSSNYVLGQVNIDKPEGMQFIKNFKVLNEVGIPSVMIFNNININKNKYFNVEGMSVSDLSKEIEKINKGLIKDSSNKYIKVTDKDDI